MVCARYGIDMMWILVVRQRHGLRTVVADSGDTPIFTDMTTALVVANRLELPRCVPWEVPGFGLISPMPYDERMTFTMARQEFASWRQLPSATEQ